MTADDPLKKVPLFGGAISAQFPARYVDVSDFRPVPDNQEVWTDADKDESVIVEIVEWNDGPSDDVGAEWFNRAAGWFWKDLAEVNGCDAGDVNLSDVRRLDNEQLPAMTEQFAKASIAVGTMKMAKGRGCGDDQKKEVEVAMANVRLPQVGTDVLVTLNRPKGDGAIGFGGAGVSILLKILETFSIDDWSLFG